MPAAFLTPAVFFPHTDRADTRSASGHAVLAHDLDGQIIDANHHFLSLLGFTRKMLIGQPISVLQELDGGQGRHQAMPILHRGQVARADVVFHTIGGALCNLQAALVPLTGRRGLCGVIIMGRDSGTTMQGMVPPNALHLAA